MLKRFAEEYRLKIRADECGDRVIRGRRGHLWFDGPELCLTILDGPPISAKRLKVLVGSTGSVWQEPSAATTTAGASRMPRFAGSGPSATGKRSGLRGAKHASAIPEQVRRSWRGPRLLV